MKTKLFSLLVALSAISNLFAYNFKYGDLYYSTTSNSTVSVIWQKGYSVDNYKGLISATIPDAVTYKGTTYMVTSISHRAFLNCTSLTSITIPNSVTSIGECAFDGCKGLTSITIPNGVTSIEGGVFNSCKGITTVVWNAKFCNDFDYDSTPFSSIGNQLTSFTIGDSVEHIPAYLCQKMENLISVSIGNSVTRIGNGAFSDCTGLTSVTIPNSVDSIGDYAFYGCTGLTSVIIGNGVTSIGNEAFYKCTGLTSITIPNSVRDIGEEAFYGCFRITSITIPNNVKSIGRSAFCCSWLTSVVWNAKSCADFGDNTSPFYDSPQYTYISIDSFTFGDSVEHIPANLCYGMRKITSITIPNSVKSIGSGAFNGCASLTSMTIPDGVMSIEEKTFYGCTGLTSVTIPNSVTRIGSGAFSDCSGLTSITIPDSVTSIEEETFYGCTGLTSLTIPNNVKSIGKGTFYNCWNLTSITIPNGVTNIGEYAFYDCTGLTSLTIPNNVKSIGKGTFYNCWNLTSITIPNGVTSIEEKTFYKCTGLTSITIPNSVTSIEYCAFSGCKGLTSIIIPDSVTSIGSSAFSDCMGLTLVTIPESVTSINRMAFYNCTGLISLTIPNSVWHIGEDAFYGVFNVIYKGNATGAPWGANNLNGYIDGYLVYSDTTKTYLWDCNTRADGEIVIPNSVTNIRSWAFSKCANITSITIPNGITSIEEGTFYNCTGLKSIAIPNSVTSIGNSAFSGCTNLTSITIPNGITSIEEGTFYNCTGLSSITIPNSVTSIGEKAFANCNKLNQLIVLAPVPPELEDYVFYYTYPQSVVVIKCYLDDYQSVRWGGFSSDKYSTYKLPVSVSSADTTLGYTKSLPVDSLMDCGDSLVVQAYPSSTAPFAFWSDGSIDNPHTIAIPDSGINLKAYFAKGLACGEEAQWQYSNGVLSITGAGTMYDYIWDNVSWRLFRDSIQQVNIAEGITSVGVCCLTGLSRLTNITLPNSITHIGDKALSGNDNLEVVVMGENIDTMGDSVFLNTPRVYQIVCKTQRVPTISENTFAEMSYRVPIYVLAACVNKYRVHEYWGRQNICSLSELTTYMVTVTCDPQYGIVTGSGTYFEGESVTLTATPNSGYVFTRWSNGKTDNPYTFVAESNLTIEAQFISSTDVENVATMSDATPRKVLRNGQVLIIENGRLYNLLGQEVTL